MANTTKKAVVATAKSYENNTLKAKKQAVNELLETTTKHISVKTFKEVGEAHGLSTNQTKRAYENFLNFGKFDLRFSSPSQVKAKATSVKLAAQLKPYTKRCKKNFKFAFKNLNSHAAGLLIHEVTFAYIHNRMREFFKVKKLNPVQYYSWIRELSIHGTLLGRKVLDYRKYGKLSVVTALKLAREMARHGRKISNTYLKSHVYTKKLSQTDVKRYIRLIKVLDLYLA